MDTFSTTAATVSDPAIIEPAVVDGPGVWPASDRRLPGAERPQRIVVIGAGLGGLAAAVRLAARGHDVTLVDKRDQPGGRAYVYRQDGFTFDGGPTVITAPWMLTDLFELAGRRAEDYISLVPVNPFYRIFFHGGEHDGEHFDYTGRSAEMVREIQRISPHESDVDGYLRFVRLTERIFAKGFTELADQPFSSPLDMARVAPDLMRLESYRTVYNLVSKFVKDERVRQVMTFHPLLVGGNPFQTTSIYTLIHYLEREWGVWFAMGGTGSIVDGLVRLFGELGGRIRQGAEVGEIMVDGGKASGVRLTTGEEIRADSVVCNGDVARAYQTLLPASVRRKYTDRRLARMRYSMSLVVIYFGTDRQYRGTDGPELGHHDIILGPRYGGLLKDIFTKKTLSDDFSLYLHVPTLTDPSLAPDGCDAFYVLSPVPHLGGKIDWATAAKPYRDRIMGFLEDNYLPDLSRHLVTEHMIDPRHFDTELNSYLGSAFSVEPILTQSAWFRPHNRSEELPNLFFAGAGTHPGAGMPGVLSSAKIVDDLIAADDRGERGSDSWQDLAAGRLGRLMDRTLNR
ncbi:MAG: Phytoene desaturase (neurosporene-forming) [uncultured Thermomicrobiales bacterium]|uniref:Phytoene dehydrogenase n=1 Tax=uncultured Thermomicrobiales bacterium TaxID=1645740 RepID=A0A6J4VD50_9BACT|nr:MAG: Phytoene desaturase (neurosporene-forming) [uncultured Thermomicrobiales bacterium]